MQEAKREIRLTGDALFLPVFRAEPSAFLRVFSGGRLCHELKMTLPQAGEEPLYFAPLPAGAPGETVLLTGASAEYLSQIQTEPQPLPAEKHPAVHFTAEYGWINDPNGLVYADGVWHLYFQYNPFAVQWANMSWGHAVSTDLLHWTQLETVLYPDAEGSMFSGSGRVNGTALPELPEDALLFFYSAAGGSTPWSQGKAFTQRLAVSTDGGRTLHKQQEPLVPTIEPENRDPKVFYHAQSKAYIQCLWLREDEFAILRSTDLRHWTLSQRFRLPDGFECPDLICLPVEDTGEMVWIFWTADGNWYPGTFDGFRFCWDQTRHRAYATALPYAAQTYANTPGRVVTVPWLRCKNNGRSYTGVMGLPRELSLTRHGDQLALVQRPVREWRAALRPCGHGAAMERLELPDGACEIRIHSEAPQDLTIRLGLDAITYCAADGNLCADGQEWTLRTGLCDFTLISDAFVLELTADEDTFYAILDRSDTADTDSVEVTAEKPISVDLFRL